MKRSSRRWWALCTVLLPWWSACAQATRYREPELDSLVTSTMQARGIPGAAVAILRRGSIVLRRGYGVQSLERRDPVTVDTRFQIGSLTKPFTATLVMMLANEGLLRLDDHARRYLRWLPLAYDSVTIRELLSHTGGVPRDLRTSNTDDMSSDEFMQRLRAATPAFPHGTRFEYANTGYILLGMLIEQVTHESYGGVLARRILRPAMMGSTIYLGGAADRAGIARGHEPVNGVQRLAPYVSGGFAAGGLSTTVADLVRFTQALDEGRLLPAATIELMTTPVKLGDRPLIAFGDTTRSYGLGWEITSWRGQRVITHGGAVSGFSAILNRSEDGTTIIVLCNSKVGTDRRGDADALARAIAALVTP